VEASGFRVSTISVVLTTGQTRDLNVSLEVQRAVESVSVTAEAPTLGTVGNSPRNAFRQQGVLAIALAAFWARTETPDHARCRSAPASRSESRRPAAPVVTVTRGMERAEPPAAGVHCG